jgi:hypothetical protein
MFNFILSSSSVDEMEQAWIKEEPLEFLTSKVEIEENDVKMENLDLPGPSSIAIEQPRNGNNF